MSNGTLEPKYSLEMTPKEQIRINHESGKYFDIDVFAARRFLASCNECPTEDDKWKAIQGWLAEKLDVPKPEITETQAREVDATIDRIYLAVNANLKKKLENSMQSWRLVPTPTSPPTGSTGPTSSSEPTKSPSQEL